METSATALPNLRFDPVLAAGAAVGELVAGAFLFIVVLVLMAMIVVVNKKLNKMWAQKSNQDCIKPFELLVFYSRAGLLCPGDSFP